jgi:anti-sigma regulatory factor (Ser/Thr protein kinase)
MPSRSCSVDLTLDLTAPRTARTLVCLLLTQWGVRDDETLDGAAIVVTELVTNALVHGDDGGPITIEVRLLDGAVVIAVVDGVPGIPRQREAGLDAENGRGLAIVEQLSLRWGVEQVAARKRVYAELPVPADNVA